MKKAVLSVVLFILVITSAGCGVWLTHYFIDSREQQELFTELAEETAVQTEQPRKTTPKRNIVDRYLGFLRPEQAEEETQENIQEAPAPHDLSALQAQNKDCIGWITVEGTGIDYPVMWTPDNPELYLKLNFQGEYSDYGVPFLDARCTPDSRNLILYGHNKWDGSMFTPLIYIDGADVGRTIRLELDGEAREYEVIAAFHTGTESPVYHFPNLTDAESVAKFLAAARQEFPALADIQPDDDLEFITLSTCTVERKNGRALVIGMRKGDADVISGTEG